jgi:hypothetical protein
VQVNGPFDADVFLAIGQHVHDLRLAGDPAGAVVLQRQRAAHVAGGGVARHHHGVVAARRRGFRPLDLGQRQIRRWPAR